MTWYCITHGFRRGPMTLDAMRALAAKGALSAEDWVWEPGLGAEWRKAGRVAELFPKQAEPVARTEPPPQPEPLPLPLPRMGEGDAPSVRAALSHALNRMVQILFKPFAAGVWLRLFLFIMMARMNPLAELAARVMQVTRNPDDPAMEPAQLARFLALRLAEKWDALATATLSGRFADAAVVLLVLLLTLVVTLHVSGWGVFLLLQGWHNPQTRFAEAFNRSRGFTRAFIRWKFVYTVPLVAVFLCGMFVFFKEAVVPFSRGAVVDASGPRVWGSLLALGGAMALLTLMNFLTDQFAAPLMWLRGVGVRAAFALVWRCAARQPFAFARLAAAYGVFTALASLFFTASAVSQAQTGNPNVLGLFMICAGYVPFHVLMRGLVLFYLAQWKPGLARRD